MDRILQTNSQLVGEYELSKKEVTKTCHLIGGEIPIKISDTPIMTKTQYRAVAGEIGFPLDFKQMTWKFWITKSVYILRNEIYGHRHWIAFTADKEEIVGLTVGHSGWMVEKKLWEDAGFVTELVEGKDKGRYLLIGRSMR